MFIKDFRTQHNFTERQFQRVALKAETDGLVVRYMEKGRHCVDAVALAPYLGDIVIPELVEEALDAEIVAVAPKPMEALGIKPYVAPVYDHSLLTQSTNAHLDAQDTLGSNLEQMLMAEVLKVESLLTRRNDAIIQVKTLKDMELNASLGKL
jgi:hypothetical protein